MVLHDLWFQSQECIQAMYVHSACFEIVKMKGLIRTNHTLHFRIWVVGNLKFRDASVEIVRNLRNGK